jgi:hypothetical protein
MAKQEELDKLSQAFVRGLQLDLTPATHQEVVKVRFSDGSIEEIPAEELQKL